jgi:hypothetical protein
MFLVAFLEPPNQVEQPYAQLCLPFHNPLSPKTKKKNKEKEIGMMKETREKKIKMSLNFV